MTSFDWMGSSDNGVPAMGLDGRDLDTRTADLQRREQSLHEQSDSLDAKLAKAEELVKKGTFEGTSERGAVTVQVDSQNRVVDIELTAKAMHLGSTDRMRSALLDAIDAAVAAKDRALADAAGLGEDFSPLDAFIQAIPEVAAVLPYELRHPPQQPRPDAPTPDLDAGLDLSEEDEEQ